MLIVSPLHSSLASSLRMFNCSGGKQPSEGVRGTASELEEGWYWAVVLCRLPRTYMRRRMCNKSNLAISLSETILASGRNPAQKPHRSGEMRQFPSRISSSTENDLHTATMFFPAKKIKTRSYPSRLTVLIRELCPQKN